MAQRRMISRSLGCSEKFAALIQSENGLAEFCHSLFPLLVVNADDSGRLQGDAFTVKHSVFPISERSVADFDRALHAMHSTGLIARYMAGLRWFIQIINFQPHQPGLLKDIKTQLPPPDAAARKHIESFSRFPADSRRFPPIPANPRESTRIPSKEGRKEVSNTPYSPPKGGRAKRPTRLELQQAERIRKNRHGCQHRPHCVNAAACIALVVEEMRTRGEDLPA